MQTNNIGQYKYQSLKDYLIGKITSGEYGNNFKLSSEFELCNQFNLSRNTTRQALLELEQDGYIYRIQGKGTFVRHVTSKESKESKKIALLIYDTIYMTYPVTAELIRGIDEVLCENNYALDILASKRTLEAEQINNLTSTYAGFLIGAYQLEEVILNSLMSSKPPCLFVKNYLDKYKDKACIIDFEKAGFLSCEHLINQGCKNLGLVYKGNDINISRDFAKGVKDAALEYGCKLKKVNQKICSFNASLESSIVAEEFITNKVDGVICFGDEFALHLLDEFQQKNINVPNDIKIVGCNNILQSKFSNPSLTTVEIPTYELGRLAAKNLLALIKGQNFDGQKMVDPQLIIRSSSQVK